jgi:hypothetical protein
MLVQSLGPSLTLCVVGFYGLVANSVVERRRELCISMALDATPLQTLTTRLPPASVSPCASGHLGGTYSTQT